MTAVGRLVTVSSTVRCSAWPCGSRPWARARDRSASTTCLPRRSCAARVASGRPASSGSVTFDTDLVSLGAAGPLAAFAGHPGVRPLQVRINLGSGDRAGGDLYGSLHPVIHGVPERVGMLSGVHLGFL